MKKMLALMSLASFVSCLSATAQVDISNVDSIVVYRKGSVDVITQDRMNKGLVNNPLEALIGQAVGVNISSNGADRLAMLSSVRVRGTTSLTGGNDPLVIIDGVYSDLSSLCSIYPGDIESFTILKNASETAPYGSRGASGVILVVTKKGSEKTFHISYDGNIAIESVYKNIKMLSGTRYRDVAFQRGFSINDGGFDTDFPSAITRMGFVQKHHVAFGSGGENSSYRASLARTDHNSIIKLHGNNNFVAKLDLDQKAFNNRLIIDLGLFGSSMQSDNIFDVQKLFYSAAAQNPTFGYGMNDKGAWDRNSQASQINTPGALIQEQDRDKILNFNTHLKFTALLSKHFTLSAFGSYSYNSSENAKYLPTWVWGQGQAYRAEVKTEEWLGNVEARWKYKFGANGFNALLLAEHQKKVQRGFFTTVRGFSDNSIGYDNLAAGSTLPYGGTGSQYENPATTSFMTQVEYDYKGVITLSANARVDGSSMFGAGNKWGFFPSVSASLDVMKLVPSWQNQQWLNKLNVHTGYGLSGNTGGIDSYNSLLLLNPTGLLSWAGTPITTLGITSNANPNLKWETQSSYDVGVEMGLWHNRIMLTAEYYYSKTRDMLYMYDVPVPPFIYPQMLANLGSMSNSGLELGMSITPLQREDMELNVNVHVAFQKNKLISLSGYYNDTYLSATDITPIGSLNGAGFHGGNNNILYQIIGEPLGVFYLPHCTGLKQNVDGTYSYAIADLDNNGVIDISDGADRYIAGQATPKMSLGSNIAFRYKDFDVSLQLNGAFGHKIYNGTSLSYMNMTSFPYYNVLAGAPEANIADQTATDYWLECGDYLNFDYLTIGWNVPVKNWSKYFSSLRLSLSVNNIATITGYSGLTPMINSYVVNSTLGIDDKRSYPPYRSYSIDFSIQF
jgi:TonB-linked SusC/RagA family outer membrane protein